MGKMIDADTRRIKLEFLYEPRDRIDDLSMSLFGIYNLSHINLVFTHEGKVLYMPACPPDEEIIPPLYEVHFNNRGNRHFWTIKIKVVDNESFEYMCDKNKFTAVCTVKHTPVKWNYWHFSLRWSTNEGDLESLEGKQRKNIMRRIGHAVRTVLSHFATLDSPQQVDLPRNCYCKN